MSVWNELDRRLRAMLVAAGWQIGWLPTTGGAMQWIAARKFERVEAPTLHRLFEAVAELRGNPLRPD